MGAARERKKLARKAARGRIKSGKRARRAARSEGRRGRSARDIVARSNLDRMSRQRIGEFGPGGTIRTSLRGAARSPLGRKLLTAFRQKGKQLITRTRGGYAGSAYQRSAGRVGPANIYGRQVARRSTSAVAVRAAVPVAIGAGAAGAAWELGRGATDLIQGGIDMVRRRGRSPARRSQSQGVPFQPGGIVPTDSITHTWVANGVPFAQLADGRVMVRRKNGTIKIFRRPRPIVLGRNPGVRDIVRADKKIEQLMKVMRKRMPAARRRTAAQHPASTQIVRAG